MTQVIPGSEPDASSDLQLRLTRLIGLRLCHDLGGLAGTIGNALEMLGDAGAEASDLAQDAADMLRRRLLLWRALLGGSEARTLGSVLGLLKGQVAGGRAHLDIGDLPEAAPLSETLVPVLLTGPLLGGAALPRGGTVRIGGDLAREIAILPIGAGANWNPLLVRDLAGAPLPRDITSRDALALWFCMSARAAELRLSLALTAGNGPAPLLISLPA